MAAQSSDQDDLKSGDTIQMEGHTLTPPNGCNGPEETQAFGSTLYHSPSWSPVRKPTPDHPETLYCLEIQVILTKDGGLPPPPQHTWQAPMMEDMLWNGKPGTMEVVVMGPGWAVLFYGRWSLGEELSIGEAQDPMFMLSWAISWVGKQAQLYANAVRLWEGWQLIAQAISEWCIEARGPTWSHLLLPASPLFSSHEEGGSQLLLNNRRFPGIPTMHHTMIDIRLYNMAGTAAKGSEIHGPPQPHLLSIIKPGVEIAPSSAMSSAPYRSTWGSWWEAQALISPWMAWLLCWMSTTSVSRL